MKSKFGPFRRGMNNRAPEFALGKPQEGGDFLRDAVNVDITAQGTIKRRKGYARVGDAPAPTPPTIPAGRVRSHLGYLATELYGEMQGKHVNRRVAVMGNKLLFSYPFAPTITNDAFQYEEFAAPITGWISTDNGLYVSADAIYFIPGTLPAKDLNQVHPVPALRGSFGAFPHSQDVFWVTKQGIVIGSQDGTQVKMLQWDNYAADLDGEAVTVYYEHDGLRQIVAIVDRQPSLIPGASQTFMEATVF